MKYLIGICDDNKSELDYIEKLAHKWAVARKHKVEIKKFISAEAFLFNYTEDKSYDILLLDIEMGKINGVDLAREIRENNREIQIIFISGYMEYIIDGYDVEALHFLLKPVKEDKLHETMDKAINKLNYNEKVLLITQGDKSIRIPLYEIRYLEVQGNYVTIYGKNEYKIRSSLKDMGRELSDLFYKVRRSYIVNLKYIRKIDKNEIYLDSGDKIPLPRGLYHDINRAIIKKL